MAEMQFIDLGAQRRRLGESLDKAIAQVLEHGQFILGPEVRQLEEQLAAFAGTRFCLTCANGTDSLALALMAWGCGAGDAVFVPSMTYAASAEAVVWTSATPVFVDIDRETFNMSPRSLEAAILWAKQAGLKPKVVMPVDLFGLPADYPRIMAIAEAHGLLVLSDSAQGFGGRINNKQASAFAHATSTSFFPAKPLGCYGDGGAVFTDDERMIAMLRSLRVHGQGSNKYDNVRVGMNSRLDTIQASILLQKLAIFVDEIEARNRVAQRYTAAFADRVATPTVPAGFVSVWAQYTLVLDDRDRVAQSCKAAGIPTMVYYPIPMTRQTAYKDYPTVPGGTPVSEELAGRVLSLPMHPYLDCRAQDRIIAAVLGAI